MKILSSSFAASLDSGATTLCWCWRLKRRDGVELGFTDHDRNIAFDGVTFEAASGFSASEITDSVGLSVDNLEVTSALRSDELDGADLAAGVYDDAAVEIYRVDWQNPVDRVLMRSGSLGEVRRSGRGFSAEIRGLAHYLQQEKGRVFQYGCDVDLGSVKCGVDVSAGAYRGSGTISNVVGGRTFTVSGFDSFDGDWFTRGVVRFLDGPAQGQRTEIKAHTLIDGIVRVEIWEAVRQPMSIGQGVEMTAGCDKTFSTCRAKFGNGTNFRGFPHIPGNDFITTFARTGRASR